MLSTQIQYYKVHHLYKKQCDILCNIFGVAPWCNVGVVSMTGEYKKDELLESARSGNEEKMMSILTPLNVNSHAGDGRKVRRASMCPYSPNLSFQSCFGFGRLGNCLGVGPLGNQELAEDATLVFV